MVAEQGEKWGLAKSVCMIMNYLHASLMLITEELGDETYEKRPKLNNKERTPNSSAARVFSCFQFLI